MKAMLPRIIFLLLVAGVIVGGVLAHSNVLIDIDLDFDPDFKANVVKSAQEYLKTTDQPVLFGYNKELIKVTFDEDEDRYVEIGPFEFEVFGFRDSGLKHESGAIQHERTERKEIAEGMLQEIHESYKQELVYGEEIEEYEKGIFKHTWYRYIDGIYSFGDHLEVYVDGVNGAVVAWRLSLFKTIREDAQTNPAFNADVARKIAELRFEATPIDFDPVLVLIKGEPAWIVKVKKLYPLYIAVNALDGAIIFSGALREELPEGYAIGPDIPVIKTELIKSLEDGT